MPDAVPSSETPPVAVVVVIFTVVDGDLQALLIKRSAEPHRGMWAVPGGALMAGESLVDAATRKLVDETGVRNVFLEQLYTFGEPKRDPRMRVITVAYYALVSPEQLLDAATEDVIRARIQVPWGGETGGPIDVLDDADSALTLAFDHADLIGMAVKRIRGKLNYAPIGYQLLPAEFTLRRLQQVHETILGNPVNKDTFRRRMLATGELEATGTLEDEVGHRPAELYRFSRLSAV